MKGTPRSIWLSWANRTASMWAGAVAATAQQQQNAMLNAMKPKKAAKSKSKPRKRSGK